MNFVVLSIGLFHFFGEKRKNFQIYKICDCDRIFRKTRVKGCFTGNQKRKRKEAKGNISVKCANLHLVTLLFEGKKCTKQTALNAEFCFCTNHNVCKT